MNFRVFVQFILPMSTAHQQKQYKLMISRFWHGLFSTTFISGDNILLNFLLNRSRHFIGNVFLHWVQKKLGCSHYFLFVLYLRASSHTFLSDFQYDCQSLIDMKRNKCTKMMKQTFYFFLLDFVNILFECKVDWTKIIRIFYVHIFCMAFCVILRDFS